MNKNIIEKIDIVFVSPTPSNCNRNPEECLGLEYLVAECRAAGYKIHYYDAWLAGMSNQQVIEAIMFDQPKIVGISPTMDSINDTLFIVDSIRKNGFSGRIVLGGIYASFLAKEIHTKTNFIDCILTGEADITFQEYLQGVELSSIAGAVYKSNKDLIKYATVKHAEIKLDALPSPARDSFSLVKKNLTPSHIMGSRGCYGNCSFCSVACFQKYSSTKRWRGRSPEKFVADLADLAAKGETMVKIIDDNFFGPTNNKTREKEIAKLIINSGIKIRLRLSLRVNDVSEEMISILKKAGLVAVSLGVESFVQRKLNSFAKGTSVDQNIKAVKILEKYGIYVQMGFIMFDAFITIDEIKHELKGLEETQNAITKGICSWLFAADGTDITKQYASEVGFIGKEGANNLYEIKDSQASLFYKAMKVWAKENSALYDQVIDPVSAPKNVSISAMKSFHKLAVELKKMDLELGWKLIKAIETNSRESVVLQIPNDFIVSKQSEISKIKALCTRLYKNTGLAYKATVNQRIY